MKDVIIACDFNDSRETLDFLERFGERRPFVKLGLELFCSQGPDMVRTLKRRGHRIFLDLKLHDIPNTVKKTLRCLALLGVDMTNVHAAGGRAMMEAALEGLLTPEGLRPDGLRPDGLRPDGRAGRTLLIAVTQLTSTSPEMLKNELLIDRGMEDTVAHYAKCALSAGLDGVVCSPLEAPAIHAACGESFLAVTPGVRFSDGAAGDQRRVATPQQARLLGSDYIVVGRPITESPDPAAAYLEACRQFLEV